MRLEKDSARANPPLRSSLPPSLPPLRRAAAVERALKSAEEIGQGEAAGVTRKGLERAWNAMAKEKLIKIDKKKAKREAMPSGGNAGDEPPSKRARTDSRSKVRFC